MIVLSLEHLVLRVFPHYFETTRDQVGYEYKFAFGGIQVAPKQTCNKTNKSTYARNPVCFAYHIHVPPLSATSRHFGVGMSRFCGSRS